MVNLIEEMQLRMNFKKTPSLIFTIILYSASAWQSAFAGSLPEFFKIDPNAPALSIGTLMMRDTNMMLLGYVTTINAKKDFNDLSETDQGIWKALYENMPTEDAPPFPIGGLISILRPIAFANVLEEEQGVLIIHVEIDADGNPRKAEVFTTPTPELGKRALEAVLLAKYTPARCSGAPCVMSIPLRIILMRKGTL